jgi:hypothetical protein
VSWGWRSRKVIFHLYFSFVAEDKHMSARSLKSVSWALTLAFVALLPVAISAQDAKSTKAATDNNPSRWDIFLGYSYLAPHGTVTTSPTIGSPITASYNAVNVGGLFSGAYFFNRYLGVQAEVGIHEWGTQSANGSNIGTHGNDDGFFSLAGGLIARFPTGAITPFVHGLVGTDDVDGPYHQPSTWGPALTVGGGLDYETPFFNHHLAIRLFQADYQYIHADFGSGDYGGRANINAARLHRAASPGDTDVLGQPRFSFPRRPDYGDGDCRQHRAQVERHLFVEWNWRIRHRNHDYDRYGRA